MKKNSIYKDARLLSKYISLTILVILFLLFILTVLIGLIVAGVNTRPVNADSNEKIIITVNPNTTTETLSHQLADKNIIRNATTFKYYLKLNNISSFQAGEYKFSPSMTLKEIAKSLESGKVYLKTAVQFEIKEGSTIELIAGVVEENTSISRETFKKKMRDRDYIKKFQKKYPDMLTDVIMNKDIRYPLEGYLAPNTYQYSESDVSLDDIIDEMLKNTYDTTFKKYKDNGAFKITKNYQETEITFHEYMTLSSIVESEMKKITDKSRYISLLINRIGNNPQSALDSDATVRYAVRKEPNEDLSESDFNNDSKYNSYTHKGIPIGPISNISEETASTTINPPDTDYYYFTKNNSGKVLFSSSLKEQKENQSK